MHTYICDTCGFRYMTLDDFTGVEVRCHLVQAFFKAFNFGPETDEEKQRRRIEFKQLVFGEAGCQGIMREVDK